VRLDCRNEHGFDCRATLDTTPARKRVVCGKCSDHNITCWQEARRPPIFRLAPWCSSRYAGALRE
jgi:hypothetical protein